MSRPLGMEQFFFPLHTQTQDKSIANANLYYYITSLLFIIMAQRLIAVIISFRVEFEAGFNTNQSHYRNPVLMLTFQNCLFRH